MLTDAEIAEVCRALGIEPIPDECGILSCRGRHGVHGNCQHWYRCFKPAERIYIYPTGNDALVAIKAALVEKDWWFYTGHNDKANDGKWYAEVLSSGFVRGPDTELDAMLQACFKAFVEDK